MNPIAANSHSNAVRSDCSVSWPLAFLFAALAMVCASATFAQDQRSSNTRTPQVTGTPARITQAVNDKELTVLHGNVHPLARPEFDQGPAPLDLQMENMLLVLRRSPEQEAALTKLLDDQQDKSSPVYHQWLTPEQFGEEFGPRDSDIQKVTDWLEGHGFHVVRVSKGRLVIEFSGTAAQVEETLKTSIRKFVVNGVEHWANATDPQIPVELTPVVAGVLTLHNFYKQPQVHVTEEQVTAQIKPGGRPQFTASNSQHAIVPHDFYTIYNFDPIQIDTSAKIAIVGRSNINLQDVTGFHFWTFDQASSPQVIVNGPDPGNLGGGEETEAVLDTTWAGAVAPTAGLELVVSKSTATTDGVDLSELYIIDNNLADVMSESFGDCETNFTSAQAAGIASLAKQAAAQGITYVVSAGDAGAAGCDDPETEKQASHPISVNMLASTPYTVAVGGTMFNENGHASTYWRSTNDDHTLQSAISYIPENVWNESCASGQAGCSKGSIWASGGGASTFFTKPSWQSGVAGVPADGARDLPDVSLTAAAHDPYLLCIRGSCVPDAQGLISFAGVSGTSTSTASFAGIMALVGQKSLVRLGQPNYVMYRLAAAENLSQCNASNTTTPPASTCVFNNVTVGNNAVPGESGYGTPSAKYQSGVGYDLATGLGSVNVTNLVNQWSTVTFSPTMTTFTISPTQATHGAPVNISGSVTPGGGTGKPTGTVWLLQNGFPNGNFVGDSTADTFTLDAQGSFSGVTHLLPGGFYQVNVHYAGDGTYGGSDSAPPVQVTIGREDTAITFSVLTTDSGGNLIPFSSGPFGTPVYFQAHVSGQSGYGMPGAYVNFWDDNGFGAGPVYLDKNGDALTPPLTLNAAGMHSITAGYVGDNSFNTSNDLTPKKFSITQLPTTTTLTSQQSAESLVLTATVSASGSGMPPTGLVTFKSGGTVLATAYALNGTTSGGTTQATATFDATQLPQGQYSVSASYPGDTNYITSSSAAVALNLQADFTVVDRGITSQTVTAGKTAMYINDIAITPFFGFSATVTLTCTVPARATTCSVNPASATTATGASIASVSVTTIAQGLVPPTMQVFRFYLGPQFVPLLLLTILLAIFIICIARTKRLRVTAALPLAVLVVVLMLQFVSCGGGSTAAPPPPPQTGTPTGTYIVTVTGSAAGGPTHSMNLQLIVK